MESSVSLESFIKQIKKEGVEEANKAAQAIIEEARSKANDILKKAEEDAQRILARGREEAHRDQKAFHAAMSQAGRDLLLSLKQRITELFDRIVQHETALALTPELMREMILKLVEKWRWEEGSHGIEILLSEDDRDKLEGMLITALQGELKKGVVLKPMERLGTGFRIGLKDGHMHYDFTQEGIAEILCEYLNPRVSRFLSRDEDDDLEPA
jgi:V/A-type H+-transporting ATPase subunit E